MTGFPPDVTFLLKASLAFAIITVCPNGSLGFKSHKLDRRFSLVLDAVKRPPLNSASSSPAVQVSFVVKSEIASASSSTSVLVSFFSSSGVSVTSFLNSASPILVSSLETSSSSFLIFSLASSSFFGSLSLTLLAFSSPSSLLPSEDDPSIAVAIDSRTPGTSSRTSTNTFVHPSLSNRFDQDEKTFSESVLLFFSVSSTFSSPSSPFFSSPIVSLTCVVCSGHRGVVSIMTMDLGVDKASAAFFAAGDDSVSPIVSAIGCLIRW
mmetsp:Transcript_16725/g.34469  ORF Transcript_16725/g.34469 Transcript_16725/m.34469 type:complete len:265 (-) Transcript_16725:1027-1821(-)